MMNGEGPQWFLAVFVGSPASVVYLVASENDMLHFADFALEARLAGELAFVRTIASGVEVVAGCAETHEVADCAATILEAALTGNGIVGGARVISRADFVWHYSRLLQPSITEDIELYHIS